MKCAQLTFLTFSKVFYCCKYSELISIKAFNFFYLTTNTRYYGFATICGSLDAKILSAMNLKHISDI